MSPTEEFPVLGRHRTKNDVPEQLVLCLSFGHAAITLVQGVHHYSKEHPGLKHEHNDAEMHVALQCSHRHFFLRVKQQLPVFARCRGLSTEKGPGITFGGESTAAADVPTTDATFRYRNFIWQTSCGKTHEYEYVVAQQPAGGQTARLDALSALEE
eukprot:3686817-Amphidinium_carterae.1